MQLSDFISNFIILIWQISGIFFDGIASVYYSSNDFLLLSMFVIKRYLVKNVSFPS